jgi:hypothetical protein
MSSDIILPSKYQIAGPWARVPDEAQRVLLNDAIARDRPAARRAALLIILWHERFLTREGLIARVEGLLGKDCFGETAWEDTFYRDMRVVKRALGAAGYQLAYSRCKERPGYYLKGEAPLHPDMVRVIAGALAEVDPAQIAIYRRLSPADRFRQGCSISDTARRAVAHRLQERRPELDQAEAFRLAGEIGADRG